MYASTELLVKLKIDDPVGAYPVHGANGIWGVIATGLFHMDKGIFGDDSNGQWGSKDGKSCIGANFFGVFMIIVWTVGTTLPLFLILKKLNLFRVSLEVEREGLDAEFERHFSSPAGKYASSAPAKSEEE